MNPEAPTVARVAPQDRLQPSLLDRLTDKEPTRKTESEGSRFLSMRELRQCVLRDLAWLLNTGNLESVEDLDGLPLVADSTVNYGIPHLAGTQISRAATPDLERRLRDAIKRFEPRILRDSVRVTLAVDEKSTSHNAVTFEIEGMLWADPVPWQIYLKTKADLELGTFSMEVAPGEKET